MGIVGADASWLLWGLTLLWFASWFLWGVDYAANTLCA